MSIELRIVNGHTECDWGTFNNPEGDPRSPMERLILTTPGWVRELLRGGPQMVRGNEVSANEDDGRTFLHLDHGGGWAWELFPAHWWDADIPMLIGRWPD